MICTTCGFAGSESARFCGGCGKPLDLAPRAAGERRQITVLMCDVVGSTALSQRLDPEDLHELMDDFQRVCQESAERHGGYTSQFLGDGVQLYFGFPQAHEDDARRAVACGLAILEGLGQLDRATRRPSSSRLRIRVGAHTGRVVVNAVGTGARSENVALGDAPNIAARVQAVAEPESLWVTEATWRMVQDHFHGEPQGEQWLKGLIAPTRLWRIAGARGAESSRDRVEQRTPYVGRGSERDAITQHWAAARAGDARFVVLRGEPGIGKSRLVDEFRRQVMNDDATVLTVRCTPYAQNSAFLPVTTLLVDRLGLHRALTAEARLVCLEAWLSEFGVDAADAAPLMADLLSIPAGERYPPLEISPVRRRARTLEILVSALRALALRRPAILIAEDLHWADPSTIEFLQLFVSSVTQLPLLALFTARPEFRPAWPTSVATPLIDVSRLDEAEVEAVARNVAGGKRIPGEVLREIAQRCDGVPLFVEEMIRSVIEAGVVEEHAQSWELTGPFRSGLIPASIDASLMARIDRLGDARATAQMGAVIGREFPQSLIRSVSGREEAALAEDLQRIIDAGLVWKTGVGDAAVYVFKHALVRDAAYESLLRRTRQAYHARIADVLQERFQDIAAEQPELIAHHHSGAGHDEQAIEFWRTAGQRALARTAMREAAAHYRRAIESVSRLPEEARWLERELDLRNEIAPVLMTVQGWGASDVRHACERARALATRLSRFDKIYPAAWGLWTYHFLRGEMDEAATTAKGAHAMAEASGIPMIRITGRHATAYTHLYRGEFAQAVKEADAGLALYDFEQEQRLAATFQLSSSIAVRTARATALWMLGETEEARQERERMIRLARDLGHTPSLAAGLAFQLHSGFGFGWMELEVEEQLRVAEELCTLSKDEGFVLWHAVAMTYRGAALVVRGHAAQGRLQMEEGLAEFVLTGARLTLVPMNAMCARAFLMMNDEERALELLEAAQDEADGRNERMWEPEIDRVKAAVQFRRGEVEAAEASLRRASAKARAQKARALEAWVERDLRDMFV